MDTKPEAEEQSRSSTTPTKEETRKKLRDFGHRRNFGYTEDDLDF